MPPVKLFILPSDVPVLHEPAYDLDAEMIARLKALKDGLDGACACNRFQRRAGVMSGLTHA
jgi:hypothetical protein